MMLHYYFLTMALCIVVSYIGMFGFFRLFDKNSPQQNDVVAIATAPPDVRLAPIVSDEPKPHWNPHEDMESVAQEAPMRLSSRSPP